MAHFSLIFLVIGFFGHAVNARPQAMDQQALNSMVLGMMSPPAPTSSLPPHLMDTDSAVKYMMEQMSEGKPAPIPPIIVVSPPMVPPMPPPMMMPPPMPIYMMPPQVIPTPLLGPPAIMPAPTAAPEPASEPETTPAPTPAPEPVTESAGPPPPAMEEPKPAVDPLPPQVVEEPTTARPIESTDYPPTQ